MIFYLIHLLKSLFSFHIPSVFLYFSTRIVLAACTSLLLAIFFGPWLIRKLYQLKVGDTVQRDYCPVLEELHAKKENTPTMGGLLILSSVLISLFLWVDLRHPFTWILMLSTCWLGALGAYDDVLKIKYKNSKGLSARKKFFWQILLGALVAMYLLVPAVSQSLQKGKWLSPPMIKEQVRGSDKPVPLTLKEYASRMYVPFFKDPIFVVSGIGTLLMALFVIFVIVGSSNAVNLTDGLDGLAAGCIIMVAASLALFAFVSNHVQIARYLHIVYVEGAGEIAVFLSAVIGACLGFLWYNGHPAQLFMGDIGSLSLGGILGVSAILLNRPFLLAIVGGIFVVEALSVIIQIASMKARNRKRVFLCTPIHHHFEYKGWPETKIVLRFWIVGFLLAIIGIASLKFQ